MTYRDDPEDGVLYWSPEVGGRRATYVLPDVHSYTYFSACPGGLPEAPLIEWALEQYPTGRLLDVGAHVGTWTIPFAQKGHNVTAFEAQPWLARLLRVNATLNRVEYQVDVHALAMTNRMGHAMLAAPHSDGGGGSIVRQFDDPVLDFGVFTDLIDNFEDYEDTGISLIKIDTEGSELGVLAGALETIRHNKPDIIFECWAEELGQERDDLFTYIDDTLEYKVTEVSWPDTYLAQPK